MAKKTARKILKLDKQGLILPLAIGALALLFFTWYFLKVSSRKTTVMENKIESVEDLNDAANDLDSQSPDSFNLDLNSNASDASGL